MLDHLEGNTCQHIAFVVSELDSGKEDWKRDPVSPDYDYALLIDRLAQLKRSREVGDYSSCIFLLRTSLNRNLGDMGNPKLHGRTHVGTKRLIDDFIDEVLKHLNLICDTEVEDLQPGNKYEFFYNCQRAFGRTALLLSGGATLGLAHIGVAKTLFENKLLPRIVSGSSVGSMIAAAICTHTDDQLPELLMGKNLNLDVFERPGEHRNWFLRIARMMKFGVVFDADVFVTAIRQNVRELSFIVNIRETGF
ncbi:hypothetical protein BJ742DRAFT_677540 [Cladochytrium replicatum]|nr:hypothetical protein BJ742DRAFT_677540 [Cladochytrium replicatum]